MVNALYSNTPQKRDRVRQSDRSAPRLADHVDALRRSAFVGRDCERFAFREALEGGPRRVLMVHGGRGLGKTTLIHEFAAMARDASTPVVVFDGDMESGRGLSTSDLTAISRVVEREDRDPAPAAAGKGSFVAQVVLIDNADGIEHSAIVGFLASLPPGIVVVLATTEPPHAQWIVDPGWHAVTIALPLAHLTTDENRQLLGNLGVPAARWGELVDLSAGHPLTIAQIAHHHRGAGQLPDFDRKPEVVDACFTGLIGEPPDAACGQALFVCAHAGTATHDLLCEVLDPADVSRAWGWLSTLGVVLRDQSGLRLTPYARRLVEAHFRRTSPRRWSSTHAAIHHAFWHHLTEERTTPHTRLIAMRGLFAGHTDSFLSALWNSEDVHQLWLHEPYHHDGPDLAKLLENTKASRGHRAAGRLTKQSEGLYTAEVDGHLAAAALTTTHICGASPACDPGLAPVFERIQECLAPRPGDVVTVLRFAVSTIGPRSAALTGVFACICEWLRRRPSVGLAYADDADGVLDNALADLAMTRISEGDADTGALYALDFRRISPESWFEFLIDNEFSGALGLPNDRLRPAPMSRAEFAQAVRDALRDLAHAPRLAENPLMNSAILKDAKPPLDVALRSRIVAACRSMGVGERERELARVLRLSHIEPTRSKRMAAKQLGLPISTFRRYLEESVDRLIGILWAAEVGSVRLTDV